MRHVSVLFVLLAAVAAWAQQPALEVASIRRNTSGGGVTRVGYSGGRYTMTNGAIINVIRSAYPAPGGITGAPSWVMADRYDITAIGPDPNAPLRPLLQALLADRFMLAVHHETQERPVYALVMARPDGRLGPDLRRSALDCDAVAAANRAGRTLEVALPSNGAPPCGMSAGRGTIRSGGTSLSVLVDNVAGPSGRPVIDKTGLTGNYEFTLRYNPQPGTDQQSDQPSIFAALEEQFGLKLQPERAPLEALVLDRIERPTED
jgi:uncharacterized protein (TIGR03435 family)